jgi:hypothetical protein
MLKYNMFDKLLNYFNLFESNNRYDKKNRFAKYSGYFIDSRTKEKVRKRMKEVEYKIIKTIDHEGKNEKFALNVYVIEKVGISDKVLDEDPINIMEMNRNAARTLIVDLCKVLGEDKIKLLEDLRDERK